MSYSFFMSATANHDLYVITTMQCIWTQRFSTLLTFCELMNSPPLPKKYSILRDIIDQMIIFTSFILREKNVLGVDSLCCVLHYYHLITQVNMTLHLHAYHVSFSSIFSMHYSKIVYNFRPIIVAQFVIREELLLYDRNFSGTN